MVPTFFPKKYISNVLDMPQEVGSVWKTGEISPSYNFLAMWALADFALLSNHSIHVRPPPDQQGINAKNLNVFLICISACACPSFWPEDTLIEEGWGSEILSHIKDQTSKQNFLPKSTVSLAIPPFFFRDQFLSVLLYTSYLATVPFLLGPCGNRSYKFAIKQIKYYILL